MATIVSGKLINGLGEPIKNCKIILKSAYTSATVVAYTTASKSPSESGDYSLSVEPGKYKVTLSIDGFQPEYVGDIQIYQDSPSGTLNYFLGLPVDSDLRPDVMKAFEAMVAKVSSQAIEVENSKKNAESSAASALTSKNAAKASEQSASSSAAAALASQNAAKASEQAAASSAQAAQASQQSAHSSESAAAGSAAAALASQNAAKASEQAAASSAQAAQASQQSAHISESAAAGSAAAALASQNAAEASEQAASSSAATAANDAATKAAAATEVKLKEAVRIDADRAVASASESNASALQAGNFASSARDSQTAAAQAATQASGSASVSVNNANAAKTSETAAAGSASSAAQSALQASASASTAASSASAAKASETAAAGSAQNAKAEADRTAGLLSTKQDKSTLLSAIAALQAAANKIVVLTGADTVEAADLSVFAKLLLSKNDAAAALEHLGLGEGSALPVGAPIPWPSATPPTGWLKCNGAAFTASQYPKLALTYPALRLPDLRGEFIRGWDDGRGIDSAREILSQQGATAFTEYHGDGTQGKPPRNYYSNQDFVNYAGPGFTAFGSDGLTANGITNFIGVRPRNIAFNYIVRAA
ncbi:prophage tail fiber N-terminal domain-containing protein [Edwardsiella tarda]